MPTLHSKVFRRRRPNFGVLLVIVCLLIVIAPIATDDELALGVELLFNLVFVAGAYWLASGEAARRPYFYLTLVAFATRWGTLLIGGYWLQLTSAVATLFWFVLSVVMTFDELFQQRRVTTNSIMGAIVAYLFVAVAFAYLYGIIEHIQPGSFSGIPEGLSRARLGDALMYFSLVSLTTVGYGDVVPVSGPARPLAGLEAAFGTLYVAVMIVRLVAVQVASRIRGEDQNAESQE